MTSPRPSFWTVRSHRTHLRAGVPLAALTVASFALASCGTPGGAVADDAPATASSAAPAPKLAPEVSVRDGASNVAVDVPVKVESRGEGLAKVSMVNEEGREVDAELSGDSRSWSTTEVLGYNRTYTLVAKDKNGQQRSVTFTTPTPAYTTGVALSPLPDSEVGIGQTIGFRFQSPVTDRKAVQDAITITTSPQVDGAFYWLNDYEVRWRPQYYWEPGTQVSVEANIYGLDMGGGLYGAQDNATNFTIGDRVIAVVDDSAKTMSVYRNKELLRVIPVSLGRDGSEFVTPNGRYIIGDKHEKLLMDSSSFGLGMDQGGYKTMVDYATQMSYSGIYVHAAPWSEWAQGSTNTSHGCINVTTEAAAWFQSVVKRGDIVHVQNTQGGTLPVWDGLGDWNLSWEEWSAGNA
ncbi:L,D-transpeptidase [Corynebacterium lizhenjunii]|uniref:L,D-transpeptidase n=1 Tax=Corynebacterium lizhenjunii TaxID=2709394 RepID=UPI001F42099B|nr:Ig-like domain-containing protein [Corynebacterium lizhenjunii]